MFPDANVLLVRWLKEALDTTRVSAIVLPEWRPDTNDGFRPQDGPWVVVSRRGGDAHSEAPLVNPSMQVRVWAGVDQFDVASARSLEVFQAIHQQDHVDFDNDGYVIAARQEGGDQDVPDSDTGFATVLSFYELRLTSNDFRA